MHSLFISKENYIYAGNYDGVFFKSTDNGLTWDSITISNSQINCIASCSNGQIYASTLDGMFSSTDYGTTWFPITNNSIGINANSIVINDSDFIFVTDFENVIKSTDYGNTWTQSGFFTYSKGVLNIDPDGTIYAGYGKLYKSIDDGQSWVNLGGPGSITSIDTYGENIYLASSSGIYRYDPDILPPNLLGKEYFPLNIQNRWQYLETTYDADGPTYKLSYISVGYDTIIGIYQYYKTTEFDDLIRYSSTEKKMYVRWNDSDYVHIDFNMPDDSFYEIFNNGHFINVYAEAGEQMLFNRNRVYGGYLYIPSSWGYEIIFTDSIGMSNDLGADSYLSTYRDIIAAIIYDSLGNKNSFTDNYKPYFQLNPITSIDSSIFSLGFTITHHYTKLSGPNDPPWHSGLDFIDSVRMEGYYSKGDSIVPVSPVIPYHTLSPANIDYSVYFLLDTLLLKNGFAFNYKFIAKDKCIIPAYSNVPDSGYFICIWDEVSNLEELENKLITFSLSQNYPNPFNPSTKIKFEIPVKPGMTMHW